jgi:hypothetical protein
MGTSWEYRPAPKLLPIAFASGNVLSIPGAGLVFPLDDLSPVQDNRFYGPWEPLTETAPPWAWSWLAIKGSLSFGFSYSAPLSHTYSTAILAASFQAQVKYDDDTISPGGVLGGLSLSGGTGFDHYARDFHAFLGGYIASDENDEYKVQATITRQKMMLYGLSISQTKPVKAIRFYAMVDKPAGVYFQSDPPGAGGAFDGATLEGPFTVGSGGGL